MNVGDYVRTKDGYILEIVNINDFREPSMKYGTEASYLKDIAFIGDENIKKSSPNIKDLLEEGDYIKLKDRGIRFFEVEGYYGGELVILDASCSELEELDEEEIVSIVTHEQMEEMEYKVNE